MGASSRDGKAGKAVPVHAAAGGRSSGSSAPASHRVSVTDDAFSPQRLDVRIGDTVAWSNEGNSVHTVTADSESFDSGDLAPGDTYSETFDEAGVFYYYCRYHGGPGGNGMSAAVVVTFAGGGSRQAPPGSHDVVVGDDSFGPSRLMVAVGDTVTWVNSNDRMHTVTADGGRFDSGDVARGRTFSFTFERVGTFYYHCPYHGDPRSGMFAVIIVTKSGGGATTPSPVDVAAPAQDCDNSGPGNCEDRAAKREEELAEARRRCRKAKREARERATSKNCAKICTVGKAHGPPGKRASAAGSRSQTPENDRLARLRPGKRPECLLPPSSTSTGR